MQATFISTGVVIALFVIQGAFAQPHLIPDAGPFGDEQGYEVMVRQVFSAGFEKNVVLRAVIIESFDTERLIGIREGANGFEAFVISPSSRIWDIELVREYENGSITVIGADRKVVPLEKDDDFKELKRRTPSDVRQISTSVRAKVIPKVFVERIERVWQRMLLGTRHTTQPRLGRDGISYYFSMWVNGYGIITGHTWSPDQGPTKALAALANQLASYSSANSSIKALEKAIRAAEQ
jgi:hypothetical protein